ncbi:MAG TPA: benzoate/H(+) symporter BenE family transporter [Thermomicrobiales bacterium]|nr:benzoate/H(+) symporter BenE family transporter [Thermomicrobiales bacterium]
MPVAIFSTAALALPLAAAAALGITSAQASNWILALYGIPGLASIVLTVVFRQPLFLAWHTGVIVFVASLGRHIPYPELLGGMTVAGFLVAALGALGLTTRVAALVPTPIIFGVVAGNVLPFVVGTFNALGNEVLLVGGALVAYLLGRRLLSPRLPPILPALLVGIALASTMGRVHALPGGWVWPHPVATMPAFSIVATLTVVPVVVPLIALHSNLTAAAYLKSEGYVPPVRAIEVTTGIGTAIASMFGPAPVCMASLVTPLTAGPEAGERAVRPWAVYASALSFLLIAIGAAVAADLPAILPLPLLLAVAGLALLGVLGQALGEMTMGPLRLGPIVAFAVTSSTLSLWGLGAAFWAIVFGTLTSRLLEGDAFNAQGEGEPSSV